MRSLVSKDLSLKELLEKEAKLTKLIHQKKKEEKKRVKKDIQEVVQKSPFSILELFGFKKEEKKTNKVPLEEELKNYFLNKENKDQKVVEEIKFKKEFKDPYKNKKKYRNKICFCGSGKKYKKCCLIKSLKD